MFDIIFSSLMTRRIQKRQKLEGQVEVLKKQQKLASERKVKEYDLKKQNLKLNTEQQIAEYEKEIKELKSEKERQDYLLAEQQKVELDEIINKYDQKITKKNNDIKKLGHLIDAERQSQEDILNPDQPNTLTQTTRKTLMEEVEEIETKTKKK